MYETGEVIATDGNLATLSMRRTEACKHCRACEVGMDGKEMRVMVKNTCGAKVHDRVRVELKSEAFLKAVLILYGLPLIGLITGFAAGSALVTRFDWGRHGSLAAFACGIFLAGLACEVIRHLEPKWRLKGYTPEATKLVTENEVESS